MVPRGRSKRSSVKLKTSLHQPPLPGLGFRQIEIWAAALGQQLAIVVVEVQREIEQAAGNGFITPQHVFFRQMQAAHASDQYRRVRFQLVDFAGFIGVGNGAVNCIVQVDLAVDDFVPAWRQRVFEVRHEHFYVGIKRIDHHLALNRPGDLDPAVTQILRNAADLPVTFTNGSGFRNKSRQFAAIDILLPADTRRQQLVAPRREFPHQFRRNSTASSVNTALRCGETLRKP